MHRLRKLSVLQFRSISQLIGSNCTRRQFLCTANQSNENERTASFGFQTVRESEKADKGIEKFVFAHKMRLILACSINRWHFSFIRSPQSVSRCSRIV